MSQGHVAQLYLDNKSGKWIAQFGGRVLASSPNKEYVVGNIRAGRCTKARQLGVTDVKEIGEVEVDTLSGKIQTVSKYPVNERFEFLTTIVDMVAKAETPSAIVIGDGGLGKTFTVTETLASAGLKDISNLNELPIGPTGDDRKLFTIIKGYSTAKGLYRTLFENRNRTVIFDDCDSVLKDPTAVNLLKGALDSYDKRIISWNAESFGDDDLPRSFEFCGGVIFISNMPRFKLDGALKTRAYIADVFMTTEEKIERMEWIIKNVRIKETGELGVISETEDKFVKVLIKGETKARKFAEGEIEYTFMEKYNIKHKKAAVDFIAKHKDEVVDLSFRTLHQVTKVAARGGDWKRLAEYVITQNS